MAKLFIHDDTGIVDVAQAFTRFGSGTVETLASGSADSVIAGMRNLVKAGKSFDRILFQTHGNSGAIFFGKDMISVTTLHGEWAGAGLSALAAPGCRVHCDGCNVAEGKAGWEFLEVLGKVFLRTGGGHTGGWTSSGVGVPGLLPLIGGHTVHLWGDFRRAWFDTTGNLLKRDTLAEERRKQFKRFYKHQPRQSIDLF